MNALRLLEALLSMMLAIASCLYAQTNVKRTPEQIKASIAAHQGDFDYLLGDWEFTAESQMYGKLRGYWSAVRLEKGQILNEYRVGGGDSETVYVTTTIRSYNGPADRLGVDRHGYGQRIAGFRHRAADGF